VANSRDWKKEVLELRKSAEELRESHPDAALMRCRKAMEVILLSIFEEKNGYIPEKYLSFSDLMSIKKDGVKDLIPKVQKMEFEVVQLWGNYGCHFQNEGIATPTQVDYALRPLENLTEWRFTSGIDDGIVDEDELEEEMESDESLDNIDLSGMKLGDDGGLWWMNNKGFKCRECGEYFRKWHAATQHKKSTGHGSKTCDICGDIIPNAGQHKKHVKNTGHNSFSGDIIPFGEWKIKHLERYLRKLVTRAYELERKNDEGWVNLGILGTQIKKIDPEFKLKEWGVSRMTELIERGFSAEFEVRKLKIRHSGKSLNKPTTIEVRLKTFSDS